MQLTCIQRTSIWSRLLLIAALGLLPGCTTDLTIDSSIHLSAGGAATIRFSPVPPTGTIRMRNSGPDQARLEFFGPSPDHPGSLDRMLTIELGPGGAIIQSISGVQRIDATTLGQEQTTIVYTIRSREGVGFAVDAGRGAVVTMGSAPEP